MKIILSNDSVSSTKKVTLKKKTDGQRTYKTENLIN